MLGLGGKRVRWTPEEDAILQQYWVSIDVIDSLCSRLPGRTAYAIAQRAQTLGLRSRGPAGRYAWTAEEDIILYGYYPAEGSRVAVRLPGHTPASCVKRAQQLGIRYTGR